MTDGGKVRGTLLKIPKTAAAAPALERAPARMPTREVDLVQQAYYMALFAILLPTGYYVIYWVIEVFGFVQAPFMWGAICSIPLSYIKRTVRMVLAPPEEVLVHTFDGSGRRTSTPTHQKKENQMKRTAVKQVRGMASAQLHRLAPTCSDRPPCTPRL